MINVRRGRTAGLEGRVRRGAGAGAATARFYGGLFITFHGMVFHEGHARTPRPARAGSPARRVARRKRLGEHFALRLNANRSVKLKGRSDEVRVSLNFVRAHKKLFLEAEKAERGGTSRGAGGGNGRRRCRGKSPTRADPGRVTPQ
ncbi:hypothetical protein EVAR_103971_1 [Eumeta japonica]|uniref:Uncharacterized protein n=1 Tax=Eumeta variegata TaxID=151549 RepID=A0A4C1STW1_EUMVA|nr:hypothetical protein EVAR_103971_1 [Eumeta japonica]